MLDLWYAVLTLAALILFVEVVVAQRIMKLEARLDLYDKLLRHTRLETQVAHNLAQTTHRLIISVTNGEEARRTVQGATQGTADSSMEPGIGVAEFDLLAQRIRYRQAAESMANDINRMVERKPFRS